MNLKWKTCSFEELNIYQLYEILVLRSEVFVVEQNCIFQDMDNADQKALHVAAYDSNTDNPSPVLVAYARIFQAGVKFQEASIGRVLTRMSYRSSKLGHLLIQQCLLQIEQRWGNTPIRIGAQMHLEKFYQQHGFISTGAPFFEDGIEHIEMLRTTSMTI